MKNNEFAKGTILDNLLSQSSQSSQSSQPPPAAVDPVSQVIGTGVDLTPESEDLITVVEALDSTTESDSVVGTLMKTMDFFDDKTVTDNRLVATIAESLLESQLLKKLQDSEREEDRTLAYIIGKTICKPKFIRFLKEKSIPLETSILQAVLQYKSRDNDYVTDEEKALEVLQGAGYHLIC